MDLGIVREDIGLPSVRATFMVEEGIGYIRLEKLEQNTDHDFGQALDELIGKGMRMLVLDLRDNTGGPPDQSIKVAGRFLRLNDVIVAIRGRAPNSNQDYRASEVGSLAELRLAVLVNGATAAGAEIIVGAFQDHGRATIVGMPTVGRASVQSIYPLSDGTRVLLTTARWLTPKGRSVRPDGLKPDVVVDSASCEEIVTGSQRDPQLERALAVLKGAR
jgi:carboxyl-terminal processing protease